MKTFKYLIAGAALMLALQPGRILAAPGGDEADCRARTLTLYKALQKQDWKALYYLAAFSPKVKKTLPGPDKFATDVKKGIASTPNGARDVDNLFNNMRNMAVGKATISGNKASVATSSTVTINKKTVNFAGAARMIKDGGVWKWDLSYTDNTELATSTQLTALIGKPRK